MYRFTCRPKHSALQVKGVPLQPGTTAPPDSTNQVFSENFFYPSPSDSEQRVNHMKSNKVESDMKRASKYMLGTLARFPEMGHNLSFIVASKLLKDKSTPSYDSVFMCL